MELPRKGQHVRVAGASNAPAWNDIQRRTRHLYSGRVRHPPRGRSACNRVGSGTSHDAQPVARTSVWVAMLLSRLMQCGLVVVCVFCAATAAAQDAQLEAVRKTVLSVRDFAQSHSDVSGAMPELTTAKHQIRDWIEARLASFPENGDEAMLSNYFLAGIANDRLFCDDDNDCRPTALGFLDEIAVNRDHGFLIVRTAVGTGIRCGYDHSAYVYEWKGSRWQRFWENEQNDYSKDAYHPQLLHAVHISDAGSDGGRLILTLGTPAGCHGAFVPFYYRVWRIGASGSTIILDKSETLNDEGEPPVIGR